MELHCKNTINLQAGASCELELDITGLISYPNISLCKGSSCTTFSLPLNITLFIANLLVAGGSSSYPNTGGIPVLSQSNDSGQTWNYPTLPSLPSGGGFGELRAASCVGMSCIVAGEENANTPLIALTHDNGQTWQYATVPTPPNDAGLYSISKVSENIFIAVGQIDSSPTSGYILRSIDGGLTWSLPNVYVPVSGTFRSVSCSGTTCVATGTKGNNGNLSPRVLEVSNDGGLTWTDQSNAANVPINSNLYAASCNSTTCVAVGEDVTVDSPLVIKSNDKGLNWSVFPLLGTFYEGGFHTAYCTDTVCVAGGFGNTQDSIPPNDTRPMIAQSINNGAWNLTFLTPPAGSTRYGFHSINCNATRCVAAGDDNNYASWESPPSPPFVGIIAQATLSGNWAWSNLASLPPGISNSIYNSTSCGTQFCFAAGQNEDNTSPLIAQSINPSSSWTYALLPSGGIGGFIGLGAAQ